MRKALFILILLASTSAHAYQPAVVSASPVASRVGIEILKKGGSAADAAIATAFALTVVEPYNSGLGGGGFLLYYEAKTKKFYFIDYREMAPLAMKASTYAAAPDQLKQGIHSVAVPGFLLGMETIHNKWRKVSWPAILEPSIELAKKGIPLRGRLREKIEGRLELFKQDPEFSRLFVEPMEKGAGKIDLEDLAATLENIKTGGAEVFYQGELGKKIASFFKKEKGLLTIKDLKKYRVYFRKPYQFEYEDYTITSAPSPSSGGQGLSYLFRRTIVNHLDRQVPYTARAYQIILKGIIDYFNYREVALGDITSNIISHTTHLCVMDEEGNIAAMTNTLNYPFGSGIVVPGTGIILNNEMDDFSLRAHSANRPRPGRRPLSSMSPTIIFEGETPKYVLGTPGGRTIPVNLFHLLYSSWKWNLTFTKAIRQPKFYYSPKQKTVVVEEKMSKKLQAALEKNHQVVTKPSIGNVQVLIIRDEKKTIPLSDPRGEGKGYVLQGGRAR